MASSQTRKAGSSEFELFQQPIDRPLGLEKERVGALGSRVVENVQQVDVDQRAIERDRQLVSVKACESRLIEGFADLVERLTQ